jgi:hypothetical protein
MNNYVLLTQEVLTNTIRKEHWRRGRRVSHLIKNKAPGSRLRACDYYIRREWNKTTRKAIRFKAHRRRRERWSRRHAAWRVLRALVHSQLPAAAATLLSLRRQVQSQRADERDSSRKGGAASAAAAGRARCLWKTGGAECGRMDAAGSDHSSGSLLRAHRAKQQFLDLKWVQGYDLLALPAEPPTPPLSLPGASTSQVSAADSFNDLAARAAACRWCMR